MTIRVLVVDDSKFIRQAMTRMLASDEEIAVVAYASDGREAIAKVHELGPDVVTLDLQMPHIDGLEVLRRIMRERPTPVVLVSAYAQSEAARTIEALALGAVDFVDKSSVSAMDVHELGAEVTRKVKNAAKSRASFPPPRPSIPDSGIPLPPPSQREVRAPSRPRMVVIGASTGGPLAIEQILTQLPAEFAAPVLVVQHMPEAFTNAFAARLAGRCALRVEESKEGTVVRPGLVMVARGGRNTEVVRSGGAMRLLLTGRPRADVHVPSLDAAAASAAEQYHSATCLVVLTGMGNDGLRGARAVRARGGIVLTQSEESCVIYGMPKAVVNEGLSTHTLPIDRLARTLVRLVNG